MLVLFILISVFLVSTGLWSLLALGSAWYWFLYVGLGLLSVVLFILIFIGIAYVVFKHTRYDGKIKHEIAWQVMDFIRIITRIKIDVKGLENIPNETFVVYANHKSMLDIIIIYVVYHKVMSAVAKDTLLKVPVLRGFMKCFKVVAINRQNDREGVKSLIEGIKLVKGGLNMLIFPEGGIKSREVETTVGMKAGAFKLATKANAAISPVSIIGSSQLSKNAPFKRTNVKVLIHKPIVASEYNGQNSFDVGDRVMQIINEGVEKGEL